MSARRPWALPLVPLYRAASAFDASLYSSGLRRTRKLHWPVISVGSLSAGGAGKTPVVIALANMLAERGYHVDILSRGYGRKGTGIALVELANVSPEEAAAHFGDEPTLIAQRTSAPVWVGSDRFSSGWKAEKLWLDGQTAHSSTPLRNDNEKSGIHILDDGLQHRRLARDFNIILVTAEDLADTLLPAGNLREPLTALRRADAVVFREEEREDVEKQIRTLAGPSAPLWSMRRTLRFPQPLGVFSAGLRPLAFCALARPEGFAASLQSSGCGVIDTVIFDDHHRYDADDLDQILKAARDLNATGFVTTEKDAVKLSPAHRAELESFGPLAVVALDADFLYKAPVMRTLEERLRTLARTTPSSDQASARQEALVR